MVTEFAHDRYNISNLEVAQIIQNVREGDMSLILRAYENEIKVRSFGNKLLSAVLTISLASFKKCCSR